MRFLLKERASGGSWLSAVTGLLHDGPGPSPATSAGVPLPGQCQRLGRLHQGRRVSPAGFGKLPHFLGGQRRVTWQLWAASPGATRGLAGSSPGWRPGCPCTSSCRHVILHHAGKGGPAGPRFPLRAQTLALFSASALFLLPWALGFPGRKRAERAAPSLRVPSRLS